ncbi:phosphoethanolamine transferase [Aliarcobacter cryaerophilus]|uniref:phosphoethanolamine transferase n=1 Tax=Aliarcobacter cryaerophilus TaxID=28198 RepID=UPI000825B291|nr:phosphoethanolamine transferase [Aliarcobacter cryaerophilus]
MINFLNGINFKYNFILALLITLLFIFVEQSYRIYSDILVFNLTIKSFFEQLLINLLIVSIVSRKAIFIIYTVLSIFVWFQLVHFSYYGTWIFPLEYLLFFTEFKEVLGTFKTLLNITIFPTFLFLFLLSFVLYTISKYDFKRVRIKHLSIFLIAAILFLPIKIYTKDDYKRNNAPNFEHYIVKNTILTLSNLLGSVIPKKLYGKSGLEQKIVETPIINSKNPDINIVLIMGETLNRDFMSLYDYKIDTTPFLNSLKNDENFLFKKGISGGVSTIVAIPNFFNMIKQPDGLPQILSTNTCLFKMAKNNGFNTYFYSSQSAEELKGIKSYLCPQYLDVMKDGSYFTRDKDSSALDENLVLALDEIDFLNPSFITLHQRVSHSPFLEFIPKDFRPFNNENTQNLNQNTIDYINTINYTDSVINSIIQKIKEKTSRPTYVIFTADHATKMGDKDRNGHGMLNNSVYKVPFFIYAINTKNDLKSSFDDFPYISHYQISNILSKLLGYNTDYQIFNKKEDFVVCGNDLSGLGGLMKISFDEDGNIIENDKTSKK